jgi:hypothetical protein
VSSLVPTAGNGNPSGNGTDANTVAPPSATQR